ncbi:MAG: hypothetical protein MJZ26_11540 [Fibrobacter sp.]|nr:hypothetical protein [Fibrobacter sp.]
MNELKPSEKLLRDLSSFVVKNFNKMDSNIFLNNFLSNPKISQYIEDVQGARDFEARIGEAMRDNPELVPGIVALHNKLYEKEPIELSSLFKDSSGKYKFDYRPLNAEGMTENELNEARNDILEALNLKDAESAYSQYYPSSEISVLSKLSGIPYNKGNGYKNEALTKFLLENEEDDFDSRLLKEKRMRSLGFVNPEAYDRYVREVLGRSNDIYAFKNGNGVRNFAIDLVAPNVNKSHSLGHDASISDVGADLVSAGAGALLGGVTKLPWVTRAAAQGFIDAGAEVSANEARKELARKGLENDKRDKRIYSAGSDYIEGENENGVGVKGVVNAGTNALYTLLGHSVGKKTKLGKWIEKKLDRNKASEKTAEQIAEENKAAVTKHFTEDRIGKGSVTRAVNKEMKSSTGAFGNAKKTIDSAKSSIGEIDTKLAELNKQGESLAMERYRLAQTHRTPENQKAIQGKINELDKKMNAIESEADKLRVTRANHVKSVDTTVLPDTPNADAVRERVLQQKIEEALNDPEKLKKIIPEVKVDKKKQYLVDFINIALPILENRGLNPIDAYGNLISGQKK